MSLRSWYQQFITFNSSFFIVSIINSFSQFTTFIIGRHHLGRYAPRSSSYRFFLQVIVLRTSYSSYWFVYIYKISVVYMVYVVLVLVIQSYNQFSRNHYRRYIIIGVHHGRYIVAFIVVISSNHSSVYS